MTTVALYLLITFGLGGVAMAVRLPPLVGFLTAGFVINALHLDNLPELEVIADLGVTLLLFAIGLKLNARILLRKEVWLTTSVHLLASVVRPELKLKAILEISRSLTSNLSIESVAPVILDALMKLYRDAERAFPSGAGKSGA